MRRIIREVEPKVPSDLPLTTHHLPLSSDLDCIILKCLEKDRSRRYETASSLAADLRRYINDQPIMARPSTRLYRARKLVRRHRVAFTAAGCVLLALFLGAAAALWGLLRERDARKGEQIALSRSTEQLHAAREFIIDILDHVAPDVAKLTGAANAQENLTTAGLNFVERLHAISSDDPELRSALATVLIAAAEAQDPGLANSIGNYSNGVKHAEEAIRLLDGPIGHGPPSKSLLLLYRAHSAAIQCLFGLGRWQDGLDRWGELEEKLREWQKDPAKAAWVRERKVNFELLIYAVLVSQGKLPEAIQGIQSFLVSEGAKQTKNDSPEPQLRKLVCAYDNLTCAYGFQRDFNAMLSAGNKATGLAELLVQRFPKDARYQAGRFYSVAQQGYALVATGAAERGFALLQTAREEVERLVATDRANDLFRYMRAIVAADQSLARSVRVENAPEEEKQALLVQAEEYLREAEQFSSEAKAQEWVPYLNAARRALESATKDFVIVPGPR
jgi:hypothetical protein